LEIKRQKRKEYRREEKHKECILAKDMFQETKENYGLEIYFSLT
jgi:hypothetical protein